MGLHISVAVMAALAIITSALTGCAGEIYIGTRRIDEVQQTQVMKDKPWKCLLTECIGEGK